MYVTCGATFSSMCDGLSSLKIGNSKRSLRIPSIPSNEPSLIQQTEFDAVASPIVVYALVALREKKVS